MINHQLVMQDRERVGLEASPTAAVEDSQSVKTTESGGVDGQATEYLGDIPIKRALDGLVLLVRDLSNRARAGGDDRLI